MGVMSDELKYRHAEAYCLMTYEADDGSESETIWNSRDGVTPFVITLRSGKTARHVNWHRDKRVPGFVPWVGMRVFVDLTPERAKELARAAAARYWADLRSGARERYATKKALARELAASYLSQPGAPDIIEWGAS